MFLIEKNVPFPGTPRGVGAVELPFEHMHVGDSFVFNEAVVKASSVSSYASRFGKDHNVKFSMRRVGENKYRVWRVA